MILVSSLSIGDIIWSGQNIVKVIAVKSNKVSVRKLEAPSDSIAQFGISFYSSSSSDLMARVAIATKEECEAYLQKTNQKASKAKQRFLANFPA